MLKNFFKVAFRNLRRHAGFSAINIAGLTFGLTACILIGLFVWDEYQYDKNIPGGDQVYRIYNIKNTDEGIQNFVVVPPMFATTLNQEFSGVEQTARIMMTAQFKILFETGNTRLYAENPAFAFAV
jgi:putative ABC transport system permease protein